MAAGEIYLKTNTPSSLFFRTVNDVEIALPGSVISGATASAGEIYIRNISGIPYIYWSVNGSTVYRASTSNISATTEPEGSLWIGSDNSLNVSIGSRRWTVSSSSPPPPPPPPPPTEIVRRFGPSSIPDPFGLGRPGVQAYDYNLSNLTCTEVGFPTYCNFGQTLVFNGVPDACGYEDYDCLN
jgi:hypothetical protein